MKKTILYAAVTAALTAAAIAIVGCNGDLGSGNPKMEEFLDKFHYNKKAVPKFTITYDGNGATGKVPVDENSPYDSGTNVIIMRADSLRNGVFRFSMWESFNENGKREYTARPEEKFLLVKNVIFFARWDSSRTLDVDVTSSIAGMYVSGSGKYTPGEPVIIDAGIPPDGWRFQNWTTTSRGVSFDDATSARTTFTMPENTVSIKAIFVVTSGTEGWLSDSRDGRAYKIVTIGEQTWMAQNLDYLNDMTTGDSSWCYENDTYNCNIYGRLYTWNAAMKACPVGWRLPDTADWNRLVTAVGGREVAGKKLKATNGWENNGNGTDDYGFLALPGGNYYNFNGKFHDIGEGGGWWGATTFSSTGGPPAYIIGMGVNDNVQTGDDEGNSGYSVRCIKDNNTYTVTVSAGTGSTGGGNYSSGATVTIKAGTAPTGLVFKGWTASDSRVIFADANNATTTFIMPSASITVRALFGSSFTDNRDSQKYGTVSIGSKIWMTENMNYTPSSGNSWCYNNEESNCVTYGRLYDWNTAKIVCPFGWHLPSLDEWEQLVMTVSDGSSTNSAASKALRTTSGWSYNNNGTDAFGFSALPGGTGGPYDPDIPLEEEDRGIVGVRGYWWSSSEYVYSDAYGTHYSAYYLSIYDKDGLMISNTYYLENGSSVRCVMND